MTNRVKMTFIVDVSMCLSARLRFLCPTHKFVCANNLRINNKKPFITD